MKNPRLFNNNRSVQNPKVRLFCFPFAGGSATTFYPWSAQFSSDIELVFINPPGRGPRIAEPPHQSMAHLIEELMVDAEYISSIPYVFFGHSVGCRVAFELCHQLKLEGFKLPEHFIASGSRPPHTCTNRTFVHQLPDEDFIVEVKKLNGTPEELFEHLEVLQLVLPTLRADFKIAETYQAQPIQMPFPMTVLNGEEDDSVPKELLNQWSELTTEHCEICQLPGDHFFINQYQPQVISKVIQVIESISLPKAV